MIITMKKILYFAFAAALVAGSGTLSSCSDFLEAENKSNPLNTDDYFSTEVGLDGLRVYTYSLLKPIVSNVDIYVQGTDLYDAAHGQDLSDFNNYALTPQSEDVSDFYTDLSSFINSANCMLKYAGDNAQVRAEGLFFRCYGYYIMTQHFGSVPYVTSYINSAERSYPKTPLSEIYPALIADLEGIMNDASLPAESTGSNLGYVSQRAVKALLAKVCLAAGWDLGTTLDNAEQGTYSPNDADGYFAKAAQYAEAAIAGQGLTMSFEDKWSPSNEGNVETIFSVQYEREGVSGNVNESGHGLQNSFGGYFGQPIPNGFKYSASKNVPSTKAAFLWGPGDERYNGTFMTAVYNSLYTNGTGGNAQWGGDNGYYAYYNSDDRDNLHIAYRYFPYYVTEAEAEAEFAANKDRYSKPAEYVNTPYAYILSDPVVMYTFNTDGTYTKASAGSYQNYLGGTYGVGGSVKIYDDPQTNQVNTNSSSDYRDIVIFHLSDMYLTAAEAYLMAGNSGEALRCVNVVRDRANAGHLNSFDDYRTNYRAYVAPASFGDITDLDVILDEKAREEFGELQRWMDLRRTRQLVRYNVAFNREVTSAGMVKWYRPIPAEELNNNTGMTDADQNPGY